MSVAVLVMETFDGDADVTAALDSVVFFGADGALVVVRVARSVAVVRGTLARRRVSGSEKSPQISKQIATTTVISATPSRAITSANIRVGFIVLP